MAPIESASHFASRSRSLIAVWVVLWILLITSGVAQGQLNGSFSGARYDLDGGVRPEFTDWPDLEEFQFAYYPVNDIQGVDAVYGTSMLQSYPLELPNIFGKEENVTIDAYYGAGAYQLSDGLWVRSSGRILGDAYLRTNSNNSLVGPMVGLGWTQTEGQIQLNVNGSVMYGYAERSVEEAVFMGTSLIPGAQNRPLYAQPSSFNRRVRHDEIAPLGKVGAGIHYILSKRARLRLEWTGFMTGDLLRVGEQWNGNVPMFGIEGATDQDYFTNTAMLSFVLNQ